MDELIKMVTEKTGLPNDKAREAVEVVVGYLKQRMPGAVGEHLNAFMSGNAGGGLTDKAKGLAEGMGGGFTNKG